MSTIYALSRLDQAKSEIRLLWLPPSNGDCKYNVITTALKDAPRFNVLSYCWGGQPRDQPILVSGCQALITESLATALRHLRPAFEGFYTWADAICINQDDLQEKTWQVQLMRDVYSAATRVIIWLGPSTSETNMAFDGIQELGHILDSIGLWQSALHMQKRLVPWLQGKVREPEFDERRDLVLQIMNQQLNATRHAIDPFSWISDDLYNREWISMSVRGLFVIRRLMQSTESLVHTRMHQCTHGRLPLRDTRKWTSRRELCYKASSSSSLTGYSMATVSLYIRLFSLYVSGTLDDRISVHDDLENLRLAFRGPVPATIVDFHMKHLVSSGDSLKFMLDRINVRSIEPEDIMAAA